MSVEVQRDGVPKQINGSQSLKIGGKRKVKENQSVWTLVLQRQHNHFVIWVCNIQKRVLPEIRQSLGLRFIKQ